MTKKKLISRLLALALLTGLAAPALAADTATVIRLEKTTGNVFFDVAEPLEDDESMCIRTSTMVVGIRGTSGYVQISDGQVTHISVLEGEIQCSVADPITGQVKTETVSGGERARGVVYDPDRAGDKCDIIKEKLTLDEIPGFVLTDLVRDIPLCDKIEVETGLDIPRDLAETDGEDPAAAPGPRAGTGPGTHAGTGTDNVYHCL